MQSLTRQSVVFFLLSLLGVGVVWFGAAPTPAKAGGGGTVTLSLTSTISFGIIEYAATHSGNIGLGTNGAVTITGIGMAYDGFAAPGQVGVTASPASGVLDVKCTSTGKLRGNASGLLDMDNAQITVSSTAGFGSGNLCHGITGGSAVATTINLATDPTPVIYLSGRLVVPAGGFSGNTSFNSTGSGGKAITLRVVFQ